MAARADQEIDYSDIPPLDGKFWKASGVPPKDVAKNLDMSISYAVPLGASLYAGLTYDFSVF